MTVHLGKWQAYYSSTALSGCTRFPQITPAFISPCTSWYTTASSSVTSKSYLGLTFIKMRHPELLKKKGVTKIGPHMLRSCKKNACFFTPPKKAKMIRQYRMLQFNFRQGNENMRVPSLKGGIPKSGHLFMRNCRKRISFLAFFMLLF